MVLGVGRPDSLISVLRKCDGLDEEEASLRLGLVSLKLGIVLARDMGCGGGGGGTCGLSKLACMLCERDGALSCGERIAAGEEVEDWRLGTRRSRLSVRSLEFE